jgi:hypothetical protein
MAYIFLDESGQFAKDGDNEYFVIASFTVADPRASYNGFRSWMRSKMPRVIRYQPEVKFADAKIGDALRIKTLEAIVSLGVRIRYSYIHKSNIPEEFRHKGALKDGHLYTHIVAETIKDYLPTNDRELRIYCDERHLKGISRREFKQNLEGHLLPLMPAGSLVQVDMVVSHDNPNVQIADWIAGALSWYHNGRPLGEACRLTLRNSLLGDGKELFKDQWVPKS